MIHSIEDFKTEGHFLQLGVKLDGFHLLIILHY